MPSPAPGEFWRTKSYCTVADQIALNIRHWQVTAVTGVAPTDRESADSFHVQLQPLYIALLSASAAFFGVAVSRVAPAPPTLDVHTGFSPSAGTRTGQELPKQVSGVIGIGTALIGRTNRGRVYVPFPAAVDNVGIGQPTAGYVTALQSLATFYASPVTITGAAGTSLWKPQIFHRRDTTFTNVTTGTARTHWATQRRRGDFGRPNPAPW